MNNDIVEQTFFANRNGGSSSRLSNSQFDPQVPSMAYSATTDPGVNSTQKRHNSLPPSYSHQAAKRTHNPLQMQLPVQNNVPVAVNYAIGASAARNNVIPVRRAGRSKAQYGSSPATHNLPSSKTPTPMQNYEVPSSPNSTFASNQNNSESSASSTAVEQSTAARTHVTVEGDVPLPRSFSQQVVAISQHPPPSQHQQQQQQYQQHQQQQQQQQRAMSEEEQQLANKLKETYKNIVSFEEIVQKACIEATAKMRGNAATTELSNDLWTIYHHNITLLNNYHDFLITALKPTANMTQLKTGRNIVDLYKIPRRMWVYGIVGYLEVLKNMMAVFQEHEIFSCFIAYCFSVVSNLTDPALEMEGWWCEKLGDLSRMAIALYSSRFIDWKISAEHWYAVSMKTMYGHGKIYYHMCTVQQDNLDALVNIGKSVICRDPFVPTQQYLRLVVENICTQRNILSLLEIPIIDFIKIHKVLMSVFASQPRQFPSSDPSQPIEPSYDAQVQYGIDLVTRYGLTFGCDSQGYNFFTRTFCLPGGPQNKYGTDPYSSVLKEQQHRDQNANALDLIEKTNFWFNKGASFAISNINHLIGLGDPKNPFAKLFQLPEALQERRDKKDRKKRSKSQSTTDVSSLETHHMLNSNNDAPLLVASDLSSVDWFLCLSHINKSVLELSFRILNYYLIGPKQASTCHVIVWLYFLIAVGKGMQANPRSQNSFLWLFRKFFPWEALINYLNTVLGVVADNSDLNDLCCDALMNDINYIDQFNQSEFLPEVWKCWGTLWFDVICMKLDYNDTESAGVRNTDLFDLPVCGTSPLLNVTDQSSQDKAKRNDKHNLDNNNDKRLIRVVLLACYIADEFDFGLLRTDQGFRFDQTIYEETATNELIKSVASDNFVGVLNYMRDIFFSDGRFSQSEFITPISEMNLIDSAQILKLNTAERDEQWFNVSSRDHDDDSVSFDMKQEDVVTDFPVADSNAYHTDYNQQNGTSDTNNKSSNIISSLGISYSETAHYGNITGNIRELNTNTNAQYLTPATRADLSVEGDMGDRMDSSLTYITFDTNIWLKHCGKIFKCVRSKVINVSIPLIVFQELRSLRKSMEATIADAATRSVIIIRELYFAQELLPLRFDGTIASDINETIEFENNANWMKNVDSTMLNVVNEYDEISKKLMKGLNYVINGSNPFVLDSKSAKLFRYCILITDDRNTRLRAKTSGLTSFQSKWLFAQLESLYPDQCID